MPPPKLHLNEHLSPRLATQLRQYGFDITSTVELDMLGVDDSEHLTYAASAQRALVTFNHKDFVLLHEQYRANAKEHWGLFFLLKRRPPSCAAVYCVYSIRFQQRNSGTKSAGSTISNRSPIAHAMGYLMPALGGARLVG